ncbi:hypothetical protein AAFC00_005470 [Neodothiora populina]|uniref:RNA helicase n=1 Tax=Neodothiora populina TaxID=2781224 RepID=A0ABR3PKZ4_9PEZI
MSGRPRSPARRGDYRRDDRDRDYRRDDRRSDYGRRRSPARYDRDRYDDRRGPRRYDDYPRDRDRKRSRDRSPARSHRDRSRDRERDGRRRDDSRDRKRPRRTDSVESRRRAPRDDDRDRRGPTPSKQDPAPVKPTVKDKAAEEERIKLERQAKLQAWKKQQEDKRKKLLEEQQQQQQSPDAANPQSPAVNSSTPSVNPAVSATASPDPSASPQPGSTQLNGAATQKGFAGKFDHKAIAKKASTANAKLQPLGSDINIPGKSKSAAIPASDSANKATDSSNKSNSSLGKAFSTTSASSALRKGFGTVRGSGEEKEKTTPQAGPAIDMDDEEVEHRKLEKLPTPDLDDDTGDAAHANRDETHDDDGDLDIADAGSEEEIAAAARAAAEKRAAEAAEVSVDADAMQGVRSTTPANGTVEIETDEVDDDVDPLDAFMNGLTEETSTTTNRKSSSRNKLLEPEAIFSEDEGADLDAVGEDPDEILAMASKRKKKEMPSVDHAKIEYEPFRKNFYTEPQEVKDMTDEEVQLLRFELDDIKVQGKDVPRPVQKFAQFGLGTQVLDIIRSLEFDKPTPIQSQTIPAIMAGRDIIGVAKTGSGKTVAFLLPMFRHIKDQRPLASMEGPVGLVLAPTRELAQQIHKECKPYLKALNLRAVCAYGGAPIKDQIAELKRGAEIIVCTPGRMVDLLAANSGRVTNLRRVTYVVLDEADRMFDMGFEPQVVKILSNIRPDHQTVLFSATMPRNMESLARKVLRKPVQITVGGRATVSDTITQIVEIRPEASKMFRTLELLGNLFTQDDDARALIFVERQEAADKMMFDLHTRGYPCSSIHGGREQIDREQAIDDFKRGDIPILIATSIAARGLDVKQLKLVINFDVPNHLEDYVHRAGRTGRAGKTGTAVTFITPEQEKYAPDLVKAFKRSKLEAPKDLVEMADGYLTKVKGGHAKATGTGFGGRGIERFEEQRALERARERKALKLGDDEEEDEKEEKKEEDKLPEINIIKRGDETTAAPTPAPVAKPLHVGIPAGVDLDADVKVVKTEIPQPATGAGPTNKLSAAAAAAASINSRLGARNSTRPGVPIDNKGPDAGAYHATLEINDFPQKARWGVTNRTNVAKILEATGVSITSKGNFYKPPDQPGEGDPPKLYILVEGDTELQVTQAMRELQRLLKEGTLAAADADARAPASGRYTVT